MSERKVTPIGQVFEKFQDLGYDFELMYSWLEENRERLMKEEREMCEDIEDRAYLSFLLNYYLPNLEKKIHPNP